MRRDHPESTGPTLGVGGGRERWWRLWWWLGVFGEWRQRCSEAEGEGVVAGEQRRVEGKPMVVVVTPEDEQWWLATCRVSSTVVGAAPAGFCARKRRGTDPAFKGEGNMEGEEARQPKRTGAGSRGSSG